MRLYVSAVRDAATATGSFVTMLAKSSHDRLSAGSDWKRSGNTTSKLRTQWYDFMLFLHILLNICIARLGHVTYRVGVVLSQKCALIVHSFWSCSDIRPIKCELYFLQNPPAPAASTMARGHGATSSYTVSYDSENHLSVLTQRLGSKWPEVRTFTNRSPENGILFSNPKT